MVVANTAVDIPACVALGFQGGEKVAVTLPEGVGDLAELATCPQGRAAFLPLLAQVAHSAR